MIDDLFDRAVDTVTQPIDDAATVIEGMTEGELRHQAALRLGTEVVAGMAIGEVVEYLQQQQIV